MNEKMARYIGAGLLALACVVVDSCRTVPITGRQQFIMSSDSEEQALGLQAFNSEWKQHGRSSNATYNTALSSCANALIKVSEVHDYEWQFMVLDSDEQNAFCAPGGKIGVYSGIMDVMRNEAELAFVVAHEIGHAVARHYGEKKAWSDVADVAAAVGKAYAGEAVSSQMLDAATQLGIKLPLSRSKEYEADEIGMILMARAGYNPSASIEFWSRFVGDSKTSGLSGLMSTHPRDEARIQAMKDLLPYAQGEYARCANKKGYGMSLR